MEYKIVAGGGAMSWSRNYSRRNTVLLRSLIARERIIIDVQRGIVRYPNGKPVPIELNFWGYARFRVQIVRRGKRINAWFFVHKAVMLADGLKLKKHHEIDHKNDDRADNRRDNLQYIHRRLNEAKKQKPIEVEPAF